MKRMKFYNAVAGICCLLTVTSSCVKEDSAFSYRETKATNITIQVAGEADRVISRAGEEIYSPRTDRSRINRLDIVLADGNTVKKIVRFDKNSPTIDADDFENTGLVSGDIPSPESSIDTGIKFRISPTDMNKVTDLYIVANYISPSTHTLNPLPDVTTVNEMNALKQGYPGDLESGTLCSMFGHISMMTSDPDFSTDTQKEYTVFLERTIAMITLAIDGTHLRNGVVVTPISAKLVHVPSTCTINGTFANQASTDNVLQEGNFIRNLNNRWGAVCNAETAAKNGEGTSVVPYAWPDDAPEDEKYRHPDGPHGTQEAILPLFMFENKQGSGTPGNGSKPEIGKTPPSGKENFCSYIEVLASYRHSTQLGGDANVGSL